MLVFTTFKPQVLLRCYLKFLVFVYKQYYNSIVVKKEGVYMWKKYFSKYKWRGQNFFYFSERQ